MLLALALNPEGADQRKIDQIRGTIGALQLRSRAAQERGDATLERWLRGTGNRGRG